MTTVLGLVRTGRRPHREVHALIPMWSTMRAQRLVLLVLSVGLVGGSMSLTAGYGLYFRSDGYRREIEAHLTEFFEMPCDVGHVRPCSFDARAFEQVAVWLPYRRDQVIFCEQAIWREIERDGKTRCELDLISGRLTLGTDQWHSDDYRHVFESGLGHDFEDLNLSEVRLKDFEISFLRGGLTIRCRDTSGNIDMSDPEEGRARLVAYELNGHRVSQGVQIFARFSPKNGVEVSELHLKLPAVPLARIGLGPVLGSELSAGHFAGEVEYRAGASGSKSEIRLRGDVVDVKLAELTQRLPIGPVEGCLSVKVEDARVFDGIITHIKGRGRISELSLDSLAPLLGESTLSGTADLNIQWIDLALGHVNSLVIDGQVRDLALEQILRRWGRGSATGKLAVNIHSLRIVNDAIQSADIEIRAVPPDDGPGTIDRDLLLDAAEEFANITWPTWLPKNLMPANIEYVEFGVRLLIHDNMLRVLGTHGGDGETILTVRVGGRPLGLVRGPSGTTDLTPWIDGFFSRVRRYDPDNVRRWWQERAGAVAPTDSVTGDRP